MNVEYGYRNDLKISFNTSLLSNEDKIRLMKDLIRDLILRDGLREEKREEIFAYLKSALEEAK